MHKINLFTLVFLMMFLCSPFTVAAVSTEAPSDVKAEKEEPFLWNLIFSNTKSIVPMVSTSVEIALSPYPPYFSPKTEMLTNQQKYTTGDRLLIQNHLWNEGDEAGDVDYYLIFFDLRNLAVIYFFDGIGWRMNTVHQYLKMGVGFDRIDTIIDVRLPPNPPIGTYTFAAGLAVPKTTTFYSISSATIEIY